MLNRFSFLIIGCFVLFVVGYTLHQFTMSGLNKGYEPIQPIKFSHKLHAGKMKMDCKYCHFAAEKGRHAGIPPVGVCMNCHNLVKTDSPEIKKLTQAYKSGKTVPWIKVHHLPDFAYFNHSQHVKVGKVACQTCHGPVETMDVVKQQNSLSMGWCINCHRQNGIAAPKDHKSAKGGDCSSCHY